MITALYFASFIAGIIALFRVLVLLPKDIICSKRYNTAFKHRRSYFKYKWSIMLLVMIIPFEIGNIKGFSWERWKYVTNQEIIDAALRATSYTVDSLKKDYNFYPVADY